MSPHEDDKSNQGVLGMEPEIALHDITGSSTSASLRFEGSIYGHKELILVDSGSTHNFLDPKMAMKLQIPLCSQDSFQVRVAKETISKGDKVNVKIQGQHFLVDFLILPLSGYDVVLGIQWLKLLSVISNNSLYPLILGAIK